MGRFPIDVTDELFQPHRLEYREPFFGGGAIGFEVLKLLPTRASIWINDKDFGVASLWKSVHESPNELIERVQRFTPSVDAFYRLKEEDGRTDLHPVETGFRKFALHQTSFSGNGVMAGGPIGGRGQRSEFNVSCRWNADRHCLEIKRLHALLSRFGNRVRITSGDFDKLIADAPEHAFVYADPPYYKAGPQLYKHALSDDDHRRLSSALRSCRGPWVLSYDDHQFIRELYQWADIRSVSLTYTTAVAQGQRRKNSELVITPSRKGKAPGAANAEGPKVDPIRQKDSTGA